MRVRIGRYGPFLQMGEGGPGKTASLPPTQAPADLTVEKALALIRAKAEGPRNLGVDPNTGMNVYAIHGRFGAYVQLGETPDKGSKDKPKRSSLTNGLTESTVTLDEAMQAARAAARARHASGVESAGRWPASAASVPTCGTATTTGRSPPRTISSPSRSNERSRFWRSQSVRPSSDQPRRVIRQIEATDGGAASRCSRAGMGRT